MTEHTKEPWRVADYNASLVECFQGKQTDHVTTPYFVGGGADQIEREANARRIVACVNACNGIPTDDLESCPEGGLFHLAAHADQLVTQRDELPAALEALTKRCAMDFVNYKPEYMPPESVFYIPLVDAAKKAIASVKGGAA